MADIHEHNLPETMRAAQWTSVSGGIEKNLKVNTKARLPKTAKSLPKDYTLVKVGYSSLNPVDYKLADSVPFIFSKPATPCADYSGIIVQSTLPHLKPGEAVFGATVPPAFGALAEYIVVGKEGCVPCPNDVPLKDAACVGIAGLTAFQCIEPFVKEGDKVFINGGSGGTGTFGIQIAKALGCHVTVTCSGPNVELCTSLGADVVIDYKSTDVLEQMSKSGKAGLQYDLIVDNVFSNTYLYWKAHRYLKPSGRYITIAGGPSIGFVTEMAKVYLWPSIFGGGKRRFTFVTATHKALHYEKMAKLMEEGKVKAVIEKQFALEDAGKAFEHLKSGRTRGKLVVKVADQELPR